MVKSMTGFGRFEAASESYKILAEIKSVNHRYLDLNIKMPKQLYPFEAAIRNLVKEYAARGKVDLFISCENLKGNNESLHYNEAIAETYAQFCRQMAEQLDIPFDLTVSKLARFPDVFTAEQTEEDPESLWDLLETAVRGAAGGLAEQRKREGGQLKEDILAKLIGMENLVSYIETRSPEIMKEYRDRLEVRMKEVLESTEIDENRILAEAAIFSDKTCVDEETVRLKSHINGMRKSLQESEGEGVGRRLDFLAQEMNREANTILSKCNHSDISEAAITLKTEIEKIREQVQNIE